MSGGARPPQDATARELHEWAAAILKASGVENARQEADWLLREALDPGAAPVGRLARLTARQVERFDGMVARRAAREPLQHVIGRWPFLDLELKVDRRALAPRPETEDLALAARGHLASVRPTLVADVGTGGGCIALAVAAAHPSAQVVAIDIDADALGLARENRALTRMEERITLVRGDLLAPVAPRAPFDLVVANLPYVREDEYESLAPEVRLFDPRQALVAADGGLAQIRRLLPQAAERLRPGGWLLLEMSPLQTRVIAAALRSQPARWESVAILRDRFERERIVEAQRSA